MWRQCALRNVQLAALLATSVLPCESRQQVNCKVLVLSLLNNAVAVPSLDTLFDLKQALKAKDMYNTGTLSRDKFGGHVFQ